MTASGCKRAIPVSYTHLDVYKRQLLHCVRNLFGDPVLVVSDSAIKLCKTEPILLSQIEEASADDTGALIIRLSTQQDIRIKRSALNIPAYTIACAINIRKQQ